MDVTVVVTEKRSVSQSIVRALTPETFDDRGETSVRHCDIISVNTRQSKWEDDLEPSGAPASFYKSCSRYLVAMKHADYMGRKSENRVRKSESVARKCFGCELTGPILATLKRFPGLSLRDLCAELERGGSPQVEQIDTRKEMLQGLVAARLEVMRERTVEEQGGCYCLTKDGRRQLQGYSKRPIVEDLHYYIFPWAGQMFIVLDTNGNPLHLSCKLGAERLWSDLAAEGRGIDWEQLQSRLVYVPAFDNCGACHRRSSVARMQLFERVLVARKMPCSGPGFHAEEPLSITRVIAATDEDIAGAAIFLSVVEYLNARGGELRSDRLYRAYLPTMEPAVVTKAFTNTGRLDWHNALAGRVRECFDYIYGTAMTKKLKKVAGVNPTNRVSTGRTLFLSLKKIIDQERLNREAKPERFVYLAFKGILGRDDITQRVAARQFTLAQLLMKRNHVSLPTFMTACCADGIGTHTTRHMLIPRLVDQGLAFVENSRVCTTLLGIACYRLLAPECDSSPHFNITEWNARVNEALRSWQTMRDADERQMQQELGSFMGAFIPAVRYHFRDLERGKRMERVARGLADIPRTRGPGHGDATKRTEGQTRREEYNGAFVIEGASSVLPPLAIQSMIESDASKPDFNEPKSGAQTNSIRILPVDCIPLADLARRVLCLSWDYDFEVDGPAYELPALQEMSYATIFRAEVNDDTALQRVLSSRLSVEDCQEMALEAPTWPDADAHDSLRLHDVRRSDILGQEGMRVVREYNRPWVCSCRLRKLVEAGNPPLESFSCGGLRFRRVSRYQYGIVHNYESLLASMLEQYGMSFVTTARIAEEMYLNPCA